MYIFITIFYYSDIKIKLNIYTVVGFDHVKEEFGIINLNHMTIFLKFNK